MTSGAAIPPGIDPGSRAFLELLGFEGFFGVGQLHAERCEGVPDECGVYALLRESPDPPEFMPRSRAPAYRGEDPTRPVDELAARWVPGAALLFLARADGTGVRSRLQQRIKRLLRFGSGRVVGHWSGRSVWQLRDHAALRVAWKPTAQADAVLLEARIRAAFMARHGRLPFANLEDDAED